MPSGPSARLGRGVPSLFVTHGTGPMLPSYRVISIWINELIQVFGPSWPGCQIVQYKYWEPVPKDAAPVHARGRKSGFSKHRQ